MIDLAINQFESNQSSVRQVASQTTLKIILAKNKARRSGLIVNSSSHDLLVWFGSKPPTERNDYLIIPSRANCDIPMFFTGDIHGVWLGSDNKSAKIYEFYGD